MLESHSLAILARAIETLDSGFSELPTVDPEHAPEALTSVLQELAVRLHDNYPYPHPLYAGQMLKPPHPVARLAYQLALYLNPNNHALDGGRATSALEREAVAAIARMVGWDTHLGHLTSGGTFANLEALWIASRERPGRVLASEQAHYTHSRLSGVLGLEFTPLASDDRSRMDLAALDAELARGGVGTVVVTLGTTATGAVDPLTAILERRERHGFRVHVDAAYGGYFAIASLLDAPAREAYALLNEADSVVIDPHKHGLQPYGCGCVLFRDPAVGRHYRHDSPYTYFTSAELHLGEISLECSRPGAAAAALWATQRLLPLVHGGAFAADLDRGLKASRLWAQRLAESGEWLVPFDPELDIVVWAPREARASVISERSRRIFEAAAKQDLHLALATLPSRFFASRHPEVERDTDTVTCLRSCLMKPAHLDWLDALWERLAIATQV